MKLKTLLLTIGLAPTFAPAQSCPCSEQFSWLRQKIERNYSGYRDKVTTQNQAAFEQHTASYQAQVDTSTSDTTCFRLLTEWARWFRDGHVQLSSNSQTEVGPDEIRRRFEDWENIALSEADARLFFTQPFRDPLEGIYASAEGNYTVALVRNPSPQRDFAAIVLTADSVWWMPGQIKFDLKETASGKFSARYYLRDHSEQTPTVRWADGVLRFAKLGAWHRIFPGTPTLAPKPQIFTLEQLEAGTLLLTLPTMNDGARKELDSLIEASQMLLKNSPNFIIDCRGNGGGSDITFYPLIEYVYSGNVTGYPSPVYATEDNIAKYDQLAQNRNFPKIHRLNFQRIARKMRRNLGAFVGTCKPFTQKVKKLSHNPQRVLVLIDGGCASSCEQLVYYARQSKRVTLIGQNTAGIFDYGNLHNMDFPCGGFNLAYPTSRSCQVDLGLGLDGVGITPDVRLEESGVDWIEFALDYLKK